MNSLSFNIGPFIIPVSRQFEIKVTGSTKTTSTLSSILCFLSCFFPEMYWSPFQDLFVILRRCSFGKDKEGNASLQTLHWRWKKPESLANKQDKRKTWLKRRKGCFDYYCSIRPIEEPAFLTLMKLFAPLESEKNIKAIINHSLHQFSRIWYYTCLRRHAWATL